MMAQRSAAERAKYWSLEKLAVTVMGHCWVAQSGFRIQGEKDLGMARDDKKNQQKKSTINLIRTALLTAPSLVTERATHWGLGNQLVLAVGH